MFNPAVDSFLKCNNICLQIGLERSRVGQSDKWTTSLINMKLLISSLFLVGAATAFSITQVEPKVVKVKEGGSFRVLCTTSDWYEVRQTTLLCLHA